MISYCIMYITLTFYCIPCLGGREGGREARGPPVDRRQSVVSSIVRTRDTDRPHPAASSLRPRSHGVSLELCSVLEPGGSGREIAEQKRGAALNVSRRRSEGGEVWGLRDHSLHCSVRISGFQILKININLPSPYKLFLWELYLWQFILLLSLSHSLFNIRNTF